VAKATGIWDVDKLENEMPLCMIAEWNQYLDYEISQYAKAILGALPAASKIGGSGGGGGEIRLTDPDAISGFFDAMNKGNGNG
jgi:hypothetical protein